MLVTNLTWTIWMTSRNQSTDSREDKWASQALKTRTLSISRTSNSNSIDMALKVQQASTSRSKSSNNCSSRSRTPRISRMTRTSLTLPSSPHKVTFSSQQTCQIPSLTKRETTLLASKRRHKQRLKISRGPKVTSTPTKTATPAKPSSTTPTSRTPLN